MRALFVALLVTPSLLFAQGRLRQNTQADFMVGRVVYSIGSRQIIDLGFAHAFKERQQFALFRSERLAWIPAGIVEVTDVGSAKSRIRSVRGSQPRVGDLVFVAYSNIGTIQSDYRDDNFVRQKILTSRYQNGYDTRPLSAGTRQLALQRRISKQWYRKADESGLRIIYGTSKEAYASGRVEQLAKQCEMIAEFQQKTPASLKSLSARWTEVLPQITGYTPPKAASEPKDGEEPVEDFADSSLVRNMLPYVNQEYGNLPLPVRETYALILGSVAVTSPKNPNSYIRERLKRTQFPNVAEEPDTITLLSEFLLNLPSDE